MKTYIEVIKFTGCDMSVVKRMDVSWQSERTIERIERGLLINMNRRDYFTKTVNSQKELEVI